MENKQFRPRAIEELISSQEKFLVPDYQRGYRWEGQQVRDLLNDVWEFKDKHKKPDNEFYCLQPVVVCKVKDDVRWELIDGQQRLTTIFLIINYINKELFKNNDPAFSIEYSTRPDSQDFLQNIEFEKKEKYIDYHFICEAYETIKSWFTERGNVTLAATQLYPVLLANTKILWYEINDELNPLFDSKDVFTRLNMGKIPLTNAELIKALFLSQDNFGDTDPIKIKLKQYEIAFEWEKIEYSLRDNEFWYFLNNEDSVSASRIEFLFDLMAKKAPKQDSFHTFNHFSNIFKQAKSNDREDLVKAEWKKVKEFYYNLEEWYNNRELYHLIGYLISIGKKISEIKELSLDLTKSVFVEKLKETIRKELVWKISLTQLNYGEHNDKIIKVLLLFNIISELDNLNSTNRFPFNRFKGNGDKKFKWSLEHIHAQSSDGLTNREHWVSWLETHKASLERIDSKKNSQLIDEIEKSIPEIKLEIFNTLFNKVLMVFKENSDTDLMHGIENMALLDKDSNSALNCSVFEVKREIIIQRELAGIFIPVCTRNVFLKYYSHPAKDLFYWSTDDRKQYLDAIIKKLQPYLTINQVIEQTEEA